MSFNKRRILLNQDEVFLERDDSDINCVYDGRFRVNKIFAVVLSVDSKSKECFFDLLGEDAATDKVCIKPFKKRRL